MATVNREDGKMYRIILTEQAEMDNLGTDGETCYRASGIIAPAGATCPFGECDIAEIEGQNPEIGDVVRVTWEDLGIGDGDPADESLRCDWDNPVHAYLV